MGIYTRYAIWVVAGLHVGFCVAEVFFWETLTPRLGVFSANRAKETAVVGRNMGVYNGIMAACLFWLLYATRMDAGNIRSPGDGPFVEHHHRGDLRRLYDQVDDPALPVVARDDRPRFALVFDIAMKRPGPARWSRHGTPRRTAHAGRTFHDISQIKSGELTGSCPTPRTSMPRERFRRSIERHDEDQGRIGRDGPVGRGAVASRPAGSG